MQELTRAEEELMRAVWKTEKPVLSHRIMENLDKENSWKITTVLTLLTKLCGKGYLKSEKSGKSNVYTVIISESEYTKSLRKSFIERFYKNSVENFFAAFCREDELSGEEIRRLKKILEKEEQDR